MPLKNLALKAIHDMPALLLQNPSQTSKAKDHLQALERRLRLWEKVNITELVNESKTIHDRLLSTSNQMNKFKQLMQNSNVNGALHLLTNNMSNGILPLSDKTLQIPSLKHPEAQQAHHKAILQGQKNQIHSIAYEDIDEDLVKKVAIKTKEGCGPSGLDANNWYRILVSNKFGSSLLELRASIANFVKQLCNTNIRLSNSDTENSLEAFTASQSIPLNKNPGARPIGVDEVLL